MMYYLGGVSGVGKSTFLQKLMETTSNIQIIKGSESFMKWLGIKQGNYAKLRSLSEKYKDKEFAKLITKFAKKEKMIDEHMILDAHYLNLRNGKIFDVTGDWLKEVDVLLLLVANAETILQRIEGDSERARELFPKSSSAVEKFQILEEYINRTAKRAKKAAKDYGKPLFVIQNNEEELETAIEVFLRIHRNLAIRNLP